MSKEENKEKEELTQEDIVPKYNTPDLFVSETFIKNMDRFFEEWQNNPLETFKKVKRDLDKAFDENNTQKIEDYWRFAKGIQSFSKIMKNSIDDLLNGNIEITFENIKKSMKNELYGFDIEDLEEI